MSSSSISTLVRAVTGVIADEGAEVDDEKDGDDDEDDGVDDEDGGDDDEGGDDNEDGVDFILMMMTKRSVERQIATPVWFLVHF